MDNQQLFIKMGLQAWNTHITRVDKLLDGLTDEQWSQEIAPGKNRISYLVGHLLAIHDRMIELFELGKRSYPQLDDAYIEKPDKAVSGLPPVSELRKYWKKSNEELKSYFNNMSPDDWFTKHTAVSAEDFATQPERNKLNLLINRTNHMAYHYGQMVLIK
jgi:uncharacterized damage-inducible protein DinB